MYIDVPITGSVVRSRGQDSLDFGEWYTMSNCRLKRADLRQVHNDWGRTSLGSDGSNTILGLFYLSFEGSDDKLLVVSTDGSTETYLKTTDPDTWSLSTIQTISAVATACGVVHRGDRYYVGTDQGNYVVQDNVSRAMGMTAPTLTAANIDSAELVQNDAAGTTGNTKAGDCVFVFHTEYDSSDDLESGPINANYEVIDDNAGAGGADEEDFLEYGPWDTTTTPTNSNADQVRIYYGYLGNAGDPNDITSAAYSAQTDWIKNADRFTIYPAGLVATVDYDNVGDSGAYHYDWGAQRSTPLPLFPVVRTELAYGGSLFEFLVKPANFTLGCLFNDSLVLNDPATSTQVLRYSPPGYPEYQPEPYFMYFATDKSDSIVGLRVINNRLLVLLNGSVHRVNYLPFEGNVAAFQGRVQEPVAGSVGCVGREAHTKVETDNGEFVVWLSTRGLEMSNGQGWTDACPDWDSSSITGTASECKVINNPVASRIELYDGTTRWDFYYDPTLLKNGRFRLMGPSTHPVAVRFATATQDRAWTASTATAYKEQVGANSSDSVLETGYLRAPEGRHALVLVDGCGLQHSAASSTTCTFKVWGKLQGQAEKGGIPYTVPDMELEESGDVRLVEMGNQIRVQGTLAGSDSWRVGPLEIQVTFKRGPNG